MIDALILLGTEAVNAPPATATAEMPLALLLYWLLLAFIGLGFSALFSGLETGAYRINPIWLHIHENQKQAIRLRRLLDQPASLLSTLLLANNMANYLGTAAVTILLQQAIGLNDTQTFIANLFILTPLLLIFAETMPKDLFARYSEQWMFRLSWLLMSLKALLTFSGLVPLTLGFQSILLSSLDRVRKQKDRHAAKNVKRGVLQLTAKRRMEHLLRDIAGQGIISQEQSALAERVMDVSQLTVADEMVPWRKVVKISETARLEEIWRLADTTSKSRFPVISDAATGHSQVGRPIIGLIDVYEILYEAPPPNKALEKQKQGQLPITPFLREVMHFSRDKPLRSALRELQQSKIPFAIVTDTRHKPIGIVTIKDLVEPITGELMNW